MRRRGLKGILEARSFSERLVGLMGKNKWPSAHRGIYFSDCNSLHSFFTFLRPDILFLDKDQKILKIIPKVSPWRFFFGPWKGRHCLELPAGSARRLRLTKGVKIEF